MDTPTTEERAATPTRHKPRDASMRIAAEFMELINAADAAFRLEEEANLQKVTEEEAAEAKWKASSLKSKSMIVVQLEKLLLEVRDLTVQLQQRSVQCDDDLLSAVSKLQAEFFVSAASANSKRSRPAPAPGVEAAGREVGTRGSADHSTPVPAPGSVAQAGSGGGEWQRAAAERVHQHDVLAVKAGALRGHQEDVVAALHQCARQRSHMLSEMSEDVLRCLQRSCRDTLEQQSLNFRQRAQWLRANFDKKLAQARAANQAELAASQRLSDSLAAERERLAAEAHAQELEALREEAARGEAELRRELEPLRRDYAVTRRRVAELEEEVARREVEGRQVQERLAQAQADGRRHAREAEEVQIELASAQRKYRGALEDLSAAVRQAQEAEREATRRALEGKEEEVRQSARRVAEAEQLAAEQRRLAKEVRGTLNEARAEIAQLMAQLESHHSSAATSQHQHSALQEQLQAAASEAQKQALLQEQVLAAQAARTQLSAELTTACARASAAEARAQEAEQALDAAQQQRQQAQADVQTLRVRVRELTDDLAAERAKREAAQADAEWASEAMAASLIGSAAAPPLDAGNRAGSADSGTSASPPPLPPRPGSAAAAAGTAAASGDAGATAASAMQREVLRLRERLEDARRGFLDATDQLERERRVVDELRGQLQHALQRAAALEAAAQGVDEGPSSPPRGADGTGRGGTGRGVTGRRSTGRVDASGVLFGAGAQGDATGRRVPAVVHLSLPPAHAGSAAADARGATTQASGGSVSGGAGGDDADAAGVGAPLLTLSPRAKQGGAAAEADRWRRVLADMEAQFQDKLREAVLAERKNVLRPASEWRAHADRAEEEARLLRQQLNDVTSQMASLEMQARSQRAAAQELALVVREKDLLLGEMALLTRAYKAKLVSAGLDISQPMEPQQQQQPAQHRVQLPQSQQQQQQHQQQQQQQQQSLSQTAPSPQLAAHVSPWADSALVQASPMHRRPSTSTATRRNLRLGATGVRLSPPRARPESAPTEDSPQAEIVRSRLRAEFFSHQASASTSALPPPFAARAKSAALSRSLHGRASAAALAPAARTEARPAGPTWGHERASVPSLTPLPSSAQDAAPDSQLAEPAVLPAGTRRVVFGTAGVQALKHMRRSRGDSGVASSSDAPLFQWNA